MIAFDTETHPITPQCIAPRMVCASFCRNGAEGGEVFLREEAGEIFRELLDPAQNPREIFIGHNIAYDFGVVAAEWPDLIPWIFKAYEQGRVHDTMIRERLIYLALGRLRIDPVEKKRPRFALSDLARRHLAIDMSEAKKGEDSWRLRYSELDGVPLEEWPKAAIKYAAEDAWITSRVFGKQRKALEIAGVGEVVCSSYGAVTNEEEQTRAAWALHLITLWGIETDPEAVQALEEQLTEKIEDLHARLKKQGLLRDNGTKDLKTLRERVEEAYTLRDLIVPRTEKGSVATSRVALENSGDALLREWGAESRTEKVLSTYIPTLKAGRVHPSYSLLKESGRTSSRNPNIQNVPRFGGVRECYVPRSGHVFLAIDYATIELCALAQVCIDLFGFSEMGEAINEGRDLHLDIAATLAEVTYTRAKDLLSKGDQNIKNLRQTAKVLNFGLPGGMGAEAFCSFAETAGVHLSIAEARSLKAQWIKRWPEMVRYFEHVSNLSQFGNDFAIKQLRSNRIRGGTNYTAGCNTLFQGLAADGAKEALYMLSEEIYLWNGSIDRTPLWGSHIVAFIHDEVIIETPKCFFQDAAQRAALVMEGAMRLWIPDVRIVANPAAMERWYKDAETVRDPQTGKLELWKPPV